MTPFLSWLIFIAVAGAAYYVYAKPKLPWEGKRSGDKIIVTKGSAIRIGEEKVEKKKKKKTEKPTKVQPVAQPRIVPSSDGDSDNDVEEEDPREAIKRLHALKSGVSLEKSESTGSSSKKARGRQSGSQKTLAAPEKSSRASSTGADADIDEKESSRRVVSANDPSDMLEAPQSAAGVLKITPSTQPPREKKQKAQSTTPEPGAQSKKNQKKKEKAKAAREEELAALARAREEHKAAQKAEEAKQAKRTPQPAPSQQESAWTTGDGKKAAPKPTSGVAVTDFLDTFNTPAPAAGSDRSDDDPTTHSSNLDQSQWEEIPSHVRDETEWSTVGKKPKNNRSKPEQQGAASESDAAAASKSEPEKKGRTKPIVTATTTAMVRGKSSNGFEALSDDNSTARSSDWAEVDGWEVHPSS